MWATESALLTCACSTRLFPYGVTIGCLTLLFLVVLLMLSTNDALTPGICMMFCLVLFVLYLTGLVETGVQLFGNGNVNENCQTYVNNVNIVGPGVNTLAWLEENNICLSTLPPPRDITAWTGTHLTWSFR